MAQVLVIIPTYNEAANVRPIAHSVFHHCPEAEILFVDDNSPDGTGKLIDTICAEDKRVNVIHGECKKGLGRAYISGFKWALERGYEFIFEMDADFSHSPAELPHFLESIKEHSADLALGSRYLNGIRIINWPLSRLILSSAAGAYVRLLTGMPFTDPTGGFKCFRRTVLEAIDLDKIKSNGYSFQIEMTHTAWRLGFKIIEIPIIFEDRHLGQSKMNSSIIKEAFWMVMRLALRGKPPAKKQK
jgi:dolichol-phosphate mannosyltransferase